jgi:hypothetical protein
MYIYTYIYLDRYVYTFIHIYADDDHTAMICWVASGKYALYTLSCYNVQVHMLKKCFQP